MAEPSEDLLGVASDADVQRWWLRRVLVAWPLGLVVLVLSLAYMHEPWARWGALVLTVPVQFWMWQPRMRALR